MVKLFQFAVRIMFHVISTGARANKNCRGGGITAADATLEFSPLLRDQSAESCQRFSSQLLDLDRIQDRIRINVCGQIFETSMTNIRRYPRTLLGNCYRNEPFFDPIRNELFFDRNREAFDCIFFFYQSGGKLLKPQNMSAEEFLEELTFYEMGDDVIDKYIDTYCRHLKKSRTNDENDCSGPNQASVAPSNRRAVEQISFKSRIWQIFDKPESSVASRIVAGVSVSMIVLSIIVLCVESEFYFVTVSANSSSLSPSSDSSAVVSSNVSLGHQKEIIPVKRRRTHRHSSTLFLVESLAMTWFSIEFITRLFTCPSKVQFMRRILNVFDFLAVLPFYITLFVECDMLADELDNVKARPLSMLRITRLVRIFPILKLTRHSKNLQILGHTFRSSLNELGLLIFFFSMSVVIFSSGVYIAEQGYEPKDASLNEFSSIPAGFWWAVITMSTVGYGDMIPQTPLGKLVGSACALVGILTLSLPVPIIVSNFTYYYKEGDHADSSDSTKKGDADFGNIADTIQRYSMMSPAAVTRSKKSSSVSMKSI